MPSVGGARHNFANNLINSRSVCRVISAADAIFVSVGEKEKSAGRDTVGGSGNRPAGGLGKKRFGLLTEIGMYPRLNNLGRRNSIAQ